MQGLNTGGAPAAPRRDAASSAARAAASAVAFELEIACNDLFGFGESGEGARGRTGRARRSCSTPASSPASTPTRGACATTSPCCARSSSSRRRRPRLGGRAARRPRRLLQRVATARPGPPARSSTALSSATRTARPHELSAIGHAHLDTAWLWPLEETRRKLAAHVHDASCGSWTSTPSTSSRPRRPSTTRGSSERDPALFARRARARRARAAGCRSAAPGSSPTATCPPASRSPASCSYGQRFFERELGRRCTELWQPDVFGYTGQLPQLMREAGIDRFLTQKLSWNRFNPPEHHTFTWQGIDGSEVLTHFPPADTYNAEATVAELRGARRAPTTTTTARATACSSSATATAAAGRPRDDARAPAPRPRPARPAARRRCAHPEAFFDRLEAGARRAAHDRRRALLRVPPRHVHDARRRSSAATAAARRALHDAELLAARRRAARARAVPARRARRGCGACCCVNQFHDILPGHLDHRGQRARAGRPGGVEARADALARRGARPRSARRRPARRPSTRRPWPRARWSRARTATLVLRRRAAVRRRRRVVAARPRRGARRARRRTAASCSRTRTCARRSTPGGAIALARPPRDRPRGARRRPATASSSTRTGPVAWDAWDVDPFHLETRADCAPGRRRRRRPRARRCAPRSTFERPVGERSQLRQTVRLDAGARRLEVHTDADWHEDHRLLKVAFPLAVHADEATYETAFGVAAPPDALLHAPRPRPLRGPRPPLRRPRPSTASASRC